ncbi:MAG TPA: hypothetical protein VK421_14390 [Pyrinomonadaceae bacterium]|nr:hypothetical protein [Pyrinomonadaceae bacterium]
MHDCQATKTRLIDLAFGEAADADALCAEVRSCAGCEAEYRALSETLRAFDRAAEEARPAEEFWPQYHARLARRIAAAETDAARAPAGRAPARHPSPASWLRRALMAKWRVPAPAAVAALLLLACLTPLALRPAPAVAPSTQESRPPAPVASEPTVRTIEVPVVHEKIVTRTIYVTRPARRKTQPARMDDARLAAGSPRAAGQTAPRRDTLVGFQPAGDVRLRVIKESFENER